jgi:adenine-specific DNA-methyltransferase
MAIRYIGSKCRIAPQILDLVGEPAEGSVFVDPFAGSGWVSREAALRGWPVRANDLLPSAAVLTRAQLITAEEAPFVGLGGYEAAISALNAAPPRDGFFTREYAPTPVNDGKVRRYFTAANARRIDGMRSLISRWSADSTVSTHETTLLLADLIEGTNSVANTAGTYGCFLRGLDPRASRPIELRPRVLMARRARVEVGVGDAGAVPSRPNDVVYLDPPYTKRQYAAYYHILETLVAGDEPLVSGVTGLRPWKDRASVFCWKARALTALRRLVEQAAARRVLISYSDEGHIDLTDLAAGLRSLGEVQMHSVGSLQRYAPNAVSASRGTPVREVVLELLKSESICSIGKEACAA